MRVVTTTFLFFTALSWAGCTWSGSVVDLTGFDCGTGTIEIGMSPEDIKRSCGNNCEPVFVSKHERPALKGDAMDHFEKWLYKAAAGQNETHVLLKNGEVIRIFTTTRN
jgi:hypothetical protein